MAAVCATWIKAQGHHERFHIPSTAHARSLSQVRVASGPTVACAGAAPRRFCSEAVTSIIRCSAVACATCLQSGHRTQVHVSKHVLTHERYLLRGLQRSSDFTYRPSIDPHEEEAGKFEHKQP